MIDYDNMTEAEADAAYNLSLDAPYTLTEDEALKEIADIAKSFPGGKLSEEGNSYRREGAMGHGIDRGLIAYTAISRQCTDGVTRWQIINYA